MHFVALFFLMNSQKNYLIDAQVVASKFSVLSKTVVNNFVVNLFPIFVLLQDLFMTHS